MRKFNKCFLYWVQEVSFFLGVDAIPKLPGLWATMTTVSKLIGKESHHLKGSLKL